MHRRRPGRVAGARRPTRNAAARGPDRLHAVRLVALRFVLLAALLLFAAPAAAQSPSAARAAEPVRSERLAGASRPGPGQAGRLQPDVPRAGAGRGVHGSAGAPSAQRVPRVVRRSGGPGAGSRPIRPTPRWSSTTRRPRGTWSCWSCGPARSCRSGIVRYRVRILRGAAAGPALARVVPGRADRAGAARHSGARASSWTRAVPVGLAEPGLLAAWRGHAGGGLYFGDSAQVSPVIFTTLRGPGTVVAALNAFFLTPGAAACRRPPPRSAW